MNNLYLICTFIVRFHPNQLLHKCQNGHTIFFRLKEKLTIFVLLNGMYSCSINVHWLRLTRNYRSHQYVVYFYKISVSARWFYLQFLLCSFCINISPEGKQKKIFLFLSILYCIFSIICFTCFHVFFFIWFLLVYSYIYIDYIQSIQDEKLKARIMTTIQAHTAHHIYIFILICLHVEL